MKLSLSVRIVEAACKTKLHLPFEQLAAIAKETGYSAVCMRASAGGVQTPRSDLLTMKAQVDDAGLTVAMVTADYDVPLNNTDGPNSLRDIGPSLDVAEALGESLQSLGPRRAQIISKGMIYSPGHGDIAFTVPMFEDFLQRTFADQVQAYKVDDTKTK